MRVFSPHQNERLRQRDRDREKEREENNGRCAEYAYVLDCGDGITGVCNVQINLTVFIKYEKKMSQRGFLWV